MRIQTIRGWQDYAFDPSKPRYSIPEQPCNNPGPDRLGGVFVEQAPESPIVGAPTPERKCYHKDLCNGHSVKHYIPCSSPTHGSTSSTSGIVIFGLILAGAYLILGGKKN